MEINFNNAENILSHAKDLNVLVLNVFLKQWIEYNAAVTFLMQLSVN